MLLNKWSGCIDLPLDCAIQDTLINKTIDISLSSGKVNYFTKRVRMFVV